jgi:type I restriction enzyme S subunit
MVDKRKVPEIRFKGFSGEWEERRLDEIAPLQRGFDLPKNEMSEGCYPVVMSNGINGFHSEFKVKGPGVITGRSGTIGNLHYVETDFWPHNTALWVTDYKNNMPLYVYYMYLKLDLKRFGTGSGVPTLNRNDVHCQKEFIPCSFEQSQIGSFFKNLDSLITLHQRKYDKLTTVKKAMLEKMFPKEGADVPEIRFKGFVGRWERRTLGEVIEISSAARVHKNEWTQAGVPFFRSSDVVAAYNGNTNSKAFISVELYQELTKLIGRVQRNDVLVTGGGSIGIPYLVESNEPLYFKDADLLWFKKSENISGRFLYTFLTTKVFRCYVQSITHIGTISHYTIEQAKATPIKLPNLNEQKEIAEFFNNLDSLITLQQRELDKLKNIKKACLEKMFV